MKHWRDFHFKRSDIYPLIHTFPEITSSRTFAIDPKLSKVNSEPTGLTMIGWTGVRKNDPNSSPDSPLGAFH